MSLQKMQFYVVVKALTNSYTYWRTKITWLANIEFKEGLHVTGFLADSPI